MKFLAQLTFLSLIIPCFALGKRMRMSSNNGGNQFECPRGQKTEAWSSVPKPSDQKDGFTFVVERVDFFKNGQIVPRSKPDQHGQYNNGYSSNPEYTEKSMPGKIEPNYDHIYIPIETAKQSFSELSLEMGGSFALPCDEKFEVGYKIGGKYFYVSSDELMTNNKDIREMCFLKALIIDGPGIISLGPPFLKKNCVTAGWKKGKKQGFSKRH